MTLKKVEQESRVVKIDLQFGDDKFRREGDLPDGFELSKVGDEYVLASASGEILDLLTAAVPHPPTFDILYIGQAFGKDAEKASRNAIHRLLSHEKLLKISLTENKPNHKNYVLLLKLVEANRNFTLFLPDGDEVEDLQRIADGTDKLYNTTKKERVSLFEASFIRYFRPKYNIEFKDSFPSTDMKLLKDCYDKDFQAVIAEISIDALPVELMSPTVAASPYHAAVHNLHAKDDRRHFFSGMMAPLPVPTPPPAEQT